MALNDLKKPAPLAGAAPEEMKKRKRQEWDEIDPETGDVAENIPGIEESVGPDDLMGPGEIKAGMGLAKGLPMMAGMIGKGLTRSAESGALRSAESAAARGSLSKLSMPAVKAAAPIAESATTRDINAALRTAHPQVVKEALANPDELGKRGAQFIQELEARRVGQTAGNARAEIGAKFQDQRAKVRSNAKPEERTLDYSGMTPKFK